MKANNQDLKIPFHDAHLHRHRAQGNLRTQDSQVIWQSILFT